MTRDLLFSFLCALVVDAIQISDPFLQGATRKGAFRQLVARGNPQALRRGRLRRLEGLANREDVQCHGSDGRRAQAEKGWAIF